MEQRRKAQLRTECLYTLPAYTQDGSLSKRDLTYTQLMLSLKLIKTEWLGISRQWGRNTTSGHGGAGKRS